ncbi:hypothetical protein RB620_09110 [Paenibacillus sp. LHD-117]|uniref:SF0329 family protein n=1 Tax=Paenibacillus sp. LHD-117 TaxID=3071412 RepID=UPI0027DF025B|nr:hypothetical protein [Paenibacillus sp. LHD-117]MDQ6419588.1 hypothetical protein [Paenibacillus sp. LHD-117]
MSWSKLKQQLESFLYPALVGTVEYRATSYRYLPGKAGQCYLTVDKKNILNMMDATTSIRWYETEQEIKNDPTIQVFISEEEIAAIRQSAAGTIPEERLQVIARSRKSSELAKRLMTAQSELSKSDFVATATRFLASSIDQSLESDDILLNILALVDRRVGKKRLLNMRGIMKQKHPSVQYFYELRLGK